MRHAAAAAPVLVAGALAVFGRPAAAQDGIFAGMQKGLEFRFSTASTTETLPSGATTKTETRNMFPTLTLNMDSLIYPNLRLNAGGVFEVNMSSAKTDGALRDSTIGRNRPFFLLRSTNPVLSPGVGYFRREERARTAGVSDLKLVNEDYAAYLGWNPAGGPRSEFQFLRTQTFDASRTLQDVTKGLGTLVSNYTYRSLRADYRGSYLDTRDELRGFDTLQVTHTARVSNSARLMGDRLLWNGAYAADYQDLRTAARGRTGEVDVPVTPFGGLAAVSDLPVTARLSQNPLIVDGNLTAGAGIDIGVSAPPDDPQARNIGLDFLNRAEVNRILVWVDRELPREVADTFSWDIYSSSDNVTWKRHVTVSAAPFGPFENRFEILFTKITARYVKVVTKPLSVTVAQSSRFTDVFVTEVQAFLRRPAGEIGARLAQTTHLVNTDVRLRVLDSPSLFYEGYFLYNGPDSFDTSTTTLSNGASVNHSFGRIFSAYARGAREQGRESQGDRVATVTNATLSVDPIPTFRSSLMYTGLDERVAGLPSTRRGFIVQNTAQIYRGVDLLFGIGWNLNRQQTGEISHDRLVNLSATIVPQEHVNLTFSYDGRATERSGTFFGSPRSHMRRFYGTVAVDPIRTFHLVVGGELLVAADQKTRRTLDVVTNWSPFADGALQFTFAHNEALRDVEFGKDRNSVAAIRWILSGKSYIDVSHQWTRNEFVFQTTASRVFSVSVRLFV